MTTKKKIIGGPERKSFNVDNVYPTNFSGEDPFWDIAPVVNTLDEDIRSGKVRDFVLIKREEDGLKMTWRGTSPGTTAVGMLEWAKLQILG